MKPTQALLAPLAFLLLASPLAPAHAQSVTDDPDLDLFSALEPLTSQGDSIDLVGPFDMESDPKGRILLAYATHSQVTSCGTVAVWYGTRDAVTNLTSWLWLSDLALRCGPTDPSQVKAVTVAAMNGRAFVAVVFESRGSDVLTLYDGGTKAPWRYRPDNLAILTAQSARPIHDDRFMSPSIAIVPHARGDFSRFSVGVAYVALTSRGTPAVEMLWNDYTQPRTNWFVYHIAGEAGTIMTGSFTRPSLTADDRGPAWGVAFEQVSIQRVHIIAGEGTATPQGDRLVYSSNVESRRHHPTLRAHQSGAVLAALGDGVDNSLFNLEWAIGDLFDRATWTEQPRIFDRCRTPADLDIKRDIVTLAAQCWHSPSNRLRVGAFELDRQRRTVGSILPIDEVAGVGRQPRVAVAPPGAGVVFSAIGYATETQYPLPDTAHGNKPLMFDR